LLCRGRRTSGTYGYAQNKPLKQSHNTSPKKAGVKAHECPNTASGQG
jgi:hypothetical protein